MLAKPFVRGCERLLGAIVPPDPGIPFRLVVFGAGRSCPRRSRPVERSPRRTEIPCSLFPPDDLWRDLRATSGTIPHSAHSRIPHALFCPKPRLASNGCGAGCAQVTKGHFRVIVEEKCANSRRRILSGRISPASSISAFCGSWYGDCLFPNWGNAMMTLECQAEIHAREQYESPHYNCCRSCHRMFHAKSMDQLSLNLCDSCFDVARGLNERVPQVRVKARPHRCAKL
jgi:hypothetical protein